MTLQSHGVAASDEVGREINALAPWFHNLHLPDGRETAPDHPLGDFPRSKWRELAPALPRDLRGWRALDVGCNAGFYSFELVARGADVLAIDTDPHYLRQAAWAAERLGIRERLRFEQLHVYDLARRGERFDLVLFLGVLYHLRYPLLALDLLAERTDRMLVLQTLTMPGSTGAPVPDNVPYDARAELGGPSWPKAAFLENRFADDPTNWWAPDQACVEAMLRSSGLEVVARPGFELWVCGPRGLPDDVQSELAAACGRDAGLS